MVDLYAKPFFLDETKAQWVKDTIDSMSLEEKIGQVFFAIGLSDDDQDVLDMEKSLHIGGIMYRPHDAEKLRVRNEKLQKQAKIPLLIAANLEAGGSGALTQGTPVGSQMEVAATGKAENAYQLGAISAREAAAAGFNLAFAPVCDIDYNWRSPITNTRTYGSDPETVLKMASAYMDGAFDNHMAVSIKHFPGDGRDDRDQHLVSSVNDLSCEDWDKTYGHIYKTLIEKGAQTVMAGHIMQPEYSRRINPEIKDEEIMPASCSKELINGLLRGKLGFNGVVLTDAANMIGYTAAMSRKNEIPATINAGIDMILFGKNLQEDIRYLTEAVDNGTVSMERLDEAVTRVLALKASLDLPFKKEFVASDLCKSVNFSEDETIAEKIADESMTLVKDTQHLLPVTPEKYKRVWLFMAGDKPGFAGGTRAQDWVVEELEKVGFDVTLYDREHPSLEDTKVPMEEIRKKYDVIMYFSNIVNASYQVTARIQWCGSVAEDGPDYAREVPTLFVSLGNPYGFVDVPMIRTIINCYNASPYTVQAAVDKITGKSEFKGTSPVDPFCGKFGAGI